MAAIEGRTDDALRLYRVALDGWRGMGVRLSLVFTELDMAILLDPTEPEVKAAADEAREVLTRLRATPLLERLDAAMARSPSPQVSAASVPA